MILGGGIAGLLLPALDDGSPGVVALGLVLGLAFLQAARLWLTHHEREHPLRSRSLRLSLIHI